MLLSQFSLSSVISFAFIAAASALSLRFIYNCTLHPLAKFHGPWYAAATSLSSALISVFRLEDQWLSSLIKKYGTDSPIRVSPTILLFPKSSALRDIYWDPKCNHKMGFYDSGIFKYKPLRVGLRKCYAYVFFFQGVLGPPMLFSTLDGEEHRILRKALASNAPWSIGGLQRVWESKIDDQIRLLVGIMTEKAETGTEVCMSDRMAEFSAEIMTMVLFSEPWGFVKNSRDERNLIAGFRSAFNFISFAIRFNFFRKYILSLPILGYLLLPNMKSETGVGFLIGQAHEEISKREEDIQNGIVLDNSDFLQNCLDARIDGEPLTPDQKLAHVTLLIQAGADTTGTALTLTLRHLLMSPTKLKMAQKEIEAADQAGKLSTTAQFEEIRTHLPYVVACIKESLRISPPASGFFGRVVPKQGKYIDGLYIPPGTEVTSYQSIVQRDPDLYAPDPDSFRPERWLTPKASEYDANSFVFGVGPRVCLGKNLAFMELYKVVTEVLRVFDAELVREGHRVMTGGIRYVDDFTVKLSTRRC